MRDSFLKILMILFILFGSDVKCQNSMMTISDIESIVNSDFFYNSSESESESESMFSYIKTTDTYYNLELFTIISKKIIGSINMRLEEEPFYEKGIKFFEDFSYLDFNLNYNIGKFVISFTIYNLLSFGDNEFSIEPELFGYNHLVNDFYFIQDQNFSMQTGIAYTF